MGTSVVTRGVSYDEAFIHSGYLLSHNFSSPRLIRMVNSQNWSLHDLILVDCML